MWFHGSRAALPPKGSPQRLQPGPQWPWPWPWRRNAGLPRSGRLGMAVFSVGWAPALSSWSTVSPVLPVTQDTETGGRQVAAQKELLGRAILCCSLSLSVRPSVRRGTGAMARCGWTDAVASEGLMGHTKGRVLLKTWPCPPNQGASRSARNMPRVLWMPAFVSVKNKREKDELPGPVAACSPQGPGARVWAAA